MSAEPATPPNGVGGIFAGSLFMLESAVVDRYGGDDDRVGLRSRNDLAVAYLRQDRTPAAVPLFETALTDCRRLLGPTDPDTLTVEGNLAVAYLGADQDTAGLELMGRTVGLRERTLGRDHPVTLNAADALAAAHRVTGRHREAAVRHADVAERRSRVLGPRHPDVLASRAGLAMAWAEGSDPAGAAGLLADVVRLAEHVLGRPNRLAVTLRERLAECLVDLGRIGPARDELERAAADAERLWGPRGPETVRLRGELQEQARPTRPAP